MLDRNRTGRRSYGTPAPEDNGGLIVVSETATFPAEVLDEIDETVEHVNAQHPDAVVLLACHLDGHPTGETRPVDAEITGVDPAGVDFSVLDSSGWRTIRLAFPEPVSDPAAVQAHVFGVLLEARAAVGDTVPLTSLERDLSASTELSTHPARVLSRRELTPHLLEVRLGGLEGFAPLGPDTFVYTMVRSDRGAFASDYSIDDFTARGTEDGPPVVRGAYYTVRGWDPAAAEMVLWVVRHGDGDGVATWLAQATEGDPVLLWGPRQAYDPPADAGRHLLVADETGLAAVARIVEGLAPDARAVAVLEVGSLDDAPPMPAHPGLTIEWIERGGIEPGRHGGLYDAVSAVDLGDGRGWAAFGGAESRQVTRVRKLLRHERGLSAGQVSMTGYWRLENP
jgi:NADPH-dependent ferric siderophore reductase